MFRTVEPVLPVSAEAGPEPGKPGEFALGVPYPNPSSGAVTVPLTLAEATEVRVAVYDVLGREVAVLHEGPLSAGQHEVAFNAARLPSGLYLVQATSQGFRATRKLVVTRGL